MKQLIFSSAVLGIRRFRPSALKVRRILALAAGLFIAGLANAQTPNATITDIGATAPTPGPDDPYQLDNTNAANNKVNGNLNYYFDNNTPPGQTFIAGPNAAGYTLTSLSVATCGGGGNLPPAGQQYVLRIYSVSGSTASLLATYYSQTDFAFAEGDWLQWTGLNVPLAANGAYAYSFRRNGGVGWEGMGWSTNNPYAGGRVCLINPSTGAINYGSGGTDVDGAFHVGLAPVTALQLGATAFAPSSAVAWGTQVTATPTVTGPTPYFYQWQTDGGTGGAITNIPGETGATLAINTSNLVAGLYYYSVIVSNNSSQVATSAPALFIVGSAGSVNANLVDAGASVPSGPDDIGQFVGGSLGNYDGLNYYTDNGVNSGQWAGQTFTTGTNSQGCYLTSVAMQVAGGNSGNTTNLFPYSLHIYEVRGGLAYAVAHYSVTNFGFVYGDWLRWSGFSLVLNSNTTYAYTFGRSSGANNWAGLNASPTSADLYAGGKACTIPINGGSIVYGATGNQDGVFNLGVEPIGVGPSPLPFAQPISISPAVAVAQPVPIGTTLTLTEFTTNGTPPLHYQWRTDGGTGGTLTNIPSSDVTNLVLNTTGWAPGVYNYQVVVNNTYGSSTSVVSSISLYLTNSATLTDIGATLPAPLAHDISQPTALGGPNNPPGLNYYFDNGNPKGSVPPGQTFTTGADPNGYNLTSLAIGLAGGSGGLPVAGQIYYLRLYKVAGGIATPVAYLASQTNVFNTTDWLRWSGFAIRLAPNTTYAYTFGRASDGSGWANLGNVNGDPYTGGQVCTIPISGGTVNYSSATDYDAAFNIGLAVPGYPVVGPAIFSRTNPIYAGTPVTATAYAAGSGALAYQWQTDSGVGGALTNIPGATSPVLSIDTTGMDGLNVAYNVVVSSGGNSTTNETSLLAVSPASLPIIQTDITPSSSSAFQSGTVVFSASFTGTEPITYQWQVDKGTGPTNIVGQNNATLALNNLQTTDAGTYYLVASNSQGSTTSSGALLTIYPDPAGLFTVNFQWMSQVSAANNPGNYSDPGVSGFGSGTYWNPINGPATIGTFGTYTSASGFNDTQTSDLGLSMTVSTWECWNWTATPVIALLDSALSVRLTVAPQPFSFSLPNGYYHVVFFSCNGTESTNANSGAQITLNGVTKTALPTQDTSFVQGNNYVVFGGVHVTNATLVGSIDPAPGKDYASLNGAQLQYLGTIYTPPTPVLNWTVTGGQIQLRWTQGSLVDATNVLGPWTPNYQATSPYTVVPTSNEPQKFFRVVYP